MNSTLPKKALASASIVILLAIGTHSAFAATKKASSYVSTPSSSVLQARQLSASGGKLLSSLVNIVCLSSDPSIPSISGSGVIIDSRGIILTATHVAQLFALQDYLGSSKVQCVVRSGSPARRAYTAEPIFISNSWIRNNPLTLATSSAIGTGQYDVALLGITGTATSTPLPKSYPAIPLSPTDPSTGEPIAIGSYGAQYLTGPEVNYSLFPILVFGTISDRYTYGKGTADVFSIDGSAASQEGSSGGGITDRLGQLIGVITTSSVSGDFNTRTLNAVTAFHVRQTFLQDTGKVLDTTLAGESVSSLISEFSSQSKTIGAQLFSNISHK